MNIEAILSKTGAGNGLNVLFLHSAGTVPASTTAAVRTKNDDTLIQARAVGPNMPLESIKTIGGNDTFTPGYVEKIWSV